MRLGLKSFPALFVMTCIEICDILSGLVETLSVFSVVIIQIYYTMHALSILKGIGTPVETRSSADADNRLDAFSGQSRSTNIVPFHMLHIVSYCAIVTCL